MSGKKPHPHYSTYRTDKVVSTLHYNVMLSIAILIIAILVVTLVRVLAPAITSEEPVVVLDISCADRDPLNAGLPAPRVCMVTVEYVNGEQAVIETPFANIHTRNKTAMLHTNDRGIYLYPRGVEVCLPNPEGGGD